MFNVTCIPRGISKFEGDTISIIRGNSRIIGIKIDDTESQEPYILQDGDVLLFSVEDRRKNKVIQKVLTANDYGDDPEDPTLNLSLDPVDTIDLLEGSYQYDCLLVMAGGTPVTIVSGAFIIEHAIGTYKDLHPEDGEDDG